MISYRSAFPFVRLFHEVPSEYLWEDESGTTHRNAMMPLLFCIGQQEAHRATQEQLHDGEQAPPGFLV